MVESHVLIPLRKFSSKRGRIASFTLVEMLVSMAILVFIIGIVFSFVQGTSKIWKNTTGKVEGFRGARTAFEAMTRTLSQATLNTYYAYTYGVGSGTSAFGVTANTNMFTTNATYTTPIGFGRNSDLEIVSGQAIQIPAPYTMSLLASYTHASPVTHAVFFQAPLGMETNSAYANLGSLLNACGFYVAYGPDVFRPGYDTTMTRYRYRLYEFLQSSDSLQNYNTSASGQLFSTWGSGLIRNDWHNTGIPSMSFVLGENIIALIILPKLSVQDELAAETAYSINTATTPLGTALAPQYNYDSSCTGQGGTLYTTATSTASHPPGTTQYPLLNSLNQMPPVFQVTMVAIDEASALKLGNTTTAPNATLGLTGLFLNAASYQSDLQTLENNLAALPGNAAGNKIPLNFRVFQTDVAVRGAKWTGDN